MTQEEKKVENTPIEPKKGKKSAHKSKYYNPSVGEFGFCCESEIVAIVYNYIKRKDWGNFEKFVQNFTCYFPYEASLLSDGDLKKLFQKYNDSAIIEKIQSDRIKRINSELPRELNDLLGKYGLMTVRADGRGTKHSVKKCQRKKQYDVSRFSGYKILKGGTVIAGKRYELYEDDIRSFIQQLQSGHIYLERVWGGQK